MTKNDDGRQVLVSYRTLRRAVGVLGVSLPVGTSAPDKLPLLFGLKGEADPIGSAGLCRTSGNGILRICR